MTIRAKPGSKNAANIDGLSKTPEEDEVLYKAGSRFKVLKIFNATKTAPARIDLEEIE